MRASPAEAARKRTAVVNFPPHPSAVGAADTFPQRGKALTAKDFPIKNPGQLTV